MNLRFYPNTWFLLFSTVISLGASACTINVLDVNFGAYDVFSLTPLDTTGTIDVSCPVRSSVSITFSTGAGGYAARYLQQGTTRLNYNLYRNGGRTQILGDGTSGTVFLSANNIRNRSFTIYGRIPARQNVRAGTYTDTIIVTLTF